MSFLSTLGKIFKVVQIVAPTAEAGLNIAASVTHNDTLTSISTGLMIAEQLLGPGSGPQKKTLATAVVKSIQPGLDQAALGTSIDTLVALLNQLTTATAKLPVIAPTPPV